MSTKKGENPKRTIMKKKKLGNDKPENEKSEKGQL